MAGAHEEIGYRVTFAQVVAEQVRIGKGIHALRMLLVEKGVGQLKRREFARGSDRCCVPQKGHRMLKGFRGPWELHLPVENPAQSAHCQQAVGSLLKMEGLAR